MKAKGRPMPKRGESQEKYYARVMGTTPEKLMAGMERHHGAQKRQPRMRKAKTKRGGK